MSNEVTVSSTERLERKPTDELASRRLLSRRNRAADDDGPHLGEAMYDPPKDTGVYLNLIT